MFSTSNVRTQYVTILRLKFVLGLTLNPEYKMFENYYGESHARLNQDQSVFDSEVVSRAPLLRIFSAFLFWMPDQCMVRLEKIWIDDMLCFVRWHEFIADMKREWEKTITPVSQIRLCSVQLVTDGVSAGDSAPLS